MNALTQFERAQSKQEECEWDAQNVKVNEVVWIQYYEHVDSASKHAQRTEEHQEVEADEQHE